MRWWCFLVLFGLVWAQDYSGTYNFQGVTLVLQQDAQGNITGTMSGNGNTVQIEGFFDNGDAYGYMFDNQGKLGFLAYLNQTGLDFYMLELDAQGNPIQNTAQQYAFTRQNAMGIQGQQTQTLATNNPLGNINNPLGQSTSADPLTGTFSDGNITLNLQGVSGAYKGTLAASGQSYPAEAQGNPQSLSGTFSVNGTTFMFAALLNGDTLSLTSDGNTYQLKRQAVATSNPLQHQATPETQSKTIAQGQYATLTEDNAYAFIEAFEFALGQAGYAQGFSQAERQQILSAVTQNYPTLKPEEQQALGRMREVWTSLQANWPNMALENQQAAVLGIFALAYGEEAVQQYMAQNQGGGESGQSSGGCQTIDDCIYQYGSPSQIQDMNGSTSCWATSGCSYYDSTTNTQYYDR
jgi:hypothetical protein